MQTSLLQCCGSSSCCASTAQQRTLKARRPPSFLYQQACTPRQSRKHTILRAWQQEYAAAGSAAQPRADQLYSRNQEGAAQYQVVQPRAVEDAPAEQQSKERKADIMTLLHKNSATETLIELRSARISSLAQAITSRGLQIPSAASLAAADVSAASEDIEEQAKHSAGKPAVEQLSDLCSYEALLQRNQALMRKSRAQGVVIQAMESTLQQANVPLPRRTLDSVSLSSCASASFSTSGSDDDVSAASTARTGVVAAACVANRASQRVRKHTVKCEFKVHCATKPGDCVMIVGSHPALGSWDAEHGGALVLTWNEGHVWTGSISLDWQPGDYSPQMLSFKAVLQRKDGSMVWQQGGNHEIILGPHLGHHVKPALATIEFDSSSEGDGLPLNYQDACAAYFNNHYDSDVPEAMAKKKAAHEVQQSIKRLRKELASQTPSNSC